MQEIIHEILEYLEAHKNPKTQKQMENKGVAESTYLGVAQKDLKVLYKNIVTNMRWHSCSMI